MKRVLVAVLVLILALLCGSSFAATEYVIANNGNSIANSATLYRLNTAAGKLVKLAELRTGGQGGLADYVAQVEQAVSKDAACVFVLDDGSSDIAAFSKTGSYRKVGRYFDSELITGNEGGTLALGADGRFLYASYGLSGNIGVWKVGSDCALELTSTVSDGGTIGPIGITPNGRFLVASSGQNWVGLFGINQTDGSLSYLAAVGFSGGVCARVGECLPRGLDITKDSKYVVLAASSVDVRHQHAIPVALTARITSSGFVNPRSWALKNDANLAENNFPFFDAAGYSGSGSIYFGVVNGGGYSPGVLTATFVEKPMKFTVTTATVVDPDVADIAVTGDTMVVAQPPYGISVFRIKKNGSLKLLSTTTINEQGEGLFSLSIFPNTR